MPEVDTPPAIATRKAIPARILLPILHPIGTVKIHTRQRKIREDFTNSEARTDAIISV